MQVEASVRDDPASQKSLVTLRNHNFITSSETVEKCEKLEAEENKEEEEEEKEEEPCSRRI
jgi:hypothetical protein